MHRLQQLIKESPYWLGLPALATLAGFLPGDFIGSSTLLMLYLIMVLLASFKTGYKGLMASALISFALFNFFHTEPRYSLLMNDINELVSAILFVVFAMLAGNVSFKMKAQLNSLETQGGFLRAQVALGQKLQHVKREEEILPLLGSVSREVFSHAVDFRLLPPGTPQNPDACWYLTWTLRDRSRLDEDRQAMLLSIREQVQSVLERLSVARALQQAERKSDEDRLRSALLSSVSHDLQTPLISMMKAAITLRELDADSWREDGRVLLDAVIEESRRLESYIQNLLDMTRLGQGKLPLSRTRVSFDEIYQVALRRVSRRWPQHRITLKAEPGLPGLDVHAALIEQALCNALDNALKAGGPEQEVLVDVHKTADMVAIRICDHGPGLPEGEWEAVFDQFYTSGADEDYEKGVGLGLSICRSIFRVHGGDAVIVPPSREFRHCLLLTLPHDAA